MQNLCFPPFSKGAPTQTRRDNATRQRDQREHQNPIHLNDVFTLHAQRSSVKESLRYTTLQLPRQSHRAIASRLRERVLRDEKKEGARARNILKTIHLIDTTIKNIAINICGIGRHSVLSQADVRSTM